MIHKNLSRAVLGLLVSISAGAQEDHLCRSEEIKASRFFAEVMGEEKAGDLVKIRKKCIDMGPEAYVDETGADGYVLDVEIGTLTYNEFLKFKDKFGNYSQVPYEPSRVYNLVDFLPPAMQAMVNKNFKTNYYYEFDELFMNIGDEGLNWLMRNGISSSANCWNTVIENLRLMADQENAGTGPYMMYWPGRWEVSETLFDNSYSTEVPKSEARFGDVLLIYMESQYLEDGKPSGDPNRELQHASIVINDQLTYEKVDSSDYHPFRIGLIDETTNKILKMFSEETGNEFVKRTIKVQVRRFDYKKFVESGSAVPLRFDLVEGEYGDQDEETKAKYQAIVDLLPKAVTDLFLTLGCETGMGGGCSQAVTAVQRTKVIINSVTGYGELAPITMPDAFTEKYTGGTQVLERFTQVSYIN